MGFIGQSYLKIALEPIRTQNLRSLLMNLSQSNFNLRSPDSDLVCSYLIATVRDQTAPDQLSIPLNKLPCTRMISQPHQMTMKRQVGDLSSTPDLRPDLRKTQMEQFQFCMLHLRVTD